MHIIEVFVGRKWGGWLPLSERFSDQATAQAAAREDSDYERRRGFTPLTRRVRPL